MTQREFEFFVTTKEPHQPDGPQRGLIRRLVMRNFFETKCTSTEKETGSSELSSEATVRARGRLKTRFRLGTATEQGNIKYPKQFRVGEENRSGRRSRAAIIRPGLSNKSRENVEVRVGSCRVSPFQGNLAETNQAGDKTPISLDICPSAHRCDPFDVLPVPGTQQLDLLFKLRKLHFCFPVAA
jgi:hypothetical protein